MNTPEEFDVLVLGGGAAGKLAAWTMAKEGNRNAVIDRKYIGGSCPNVACLPSKNVIYSAKVASLVRRHREFGIETGPIAIDMGGSLCTQARHGGRRAVRRQRRSGTEPGIAQTGKPRNADRTRFAACIQ